MNQPNMDIYQNTFSDQISESDRFIDRFLNQIFALNVRSAKNREKVFQFAFLMIWLISGIFLHPPGNLDFYLIEQLAVYDIFYVKLANHLLAIFFAWDVILIIAGVYTAFFITKQLAAIYLADIFEIKDLSIAEIFVRQAAFANTATGAIHIENGQVKPEDHKSPTFRIGGPGSVQINLENAAIFEKIDGSSTIAGPTSEAPLVLEGFERLRSVIDLRDQTTNFDIFGRTRDGIAVEIKDVRLIFSVYRDDPRVTLTRPYPFNKEGLNWLVYNQVKGNWTNSLIGLVRGELARHIAAHNLSEILAAPGEPEIQQQIKTQQIIAKRIRRNYRHTARYKVYRQLYAKMKTDGPNHIPIFFWKYKHKNEIRQPIQFLNKNASSPFFTTRNKLSKLFYDEFNSSFIQRAHERGVNLEWINVGTWHTPTNLVLEQHMDAWKISSENEIRANKKVLNAVKNQSKNKELSHILQQLPNQNFYDYQYQHKTKSEIITLLIQDYASKLKLAREYFINHKGRVPRQIETALKHIRAMQLQKIKDDGGFFIGD